MRLHGQHRHWYVRHLPPQVQVLLCHAQFENRCAQYGSPRSELAAALRADSTGGCGKGAGGEVLQGGAAAALLILGQSKTQLWSCGHSASTIMFLGNTTEKMLAKLTSIFLSDIFINHCIAHFDR